MSNFSFKNFIIVISLILGAVGFAYLCYWLGHYDLPPFHFNAKAIAINSNPMNFPIYLTWADYLFQGFVPLFLYAVGLCFIVCFFAPIMWFIFPKKES